MWSTVQYGAERSGFALKPIAVAAFDHGLHYHSFRLQAKMSGFTMHSRTCGLGSVDKLRQHSFVSALQPHRLAVQRKSLSVKASVVAQPASVDVKTFDGSSSGSQDLSLRVAGRGTAKGLVHRYLVTVRQNARAVGSRACRTHNTVCFLQKLYASLSAL